MWNQDYVEYGAFDIHRSEIRVYKDRWNYIRVNCNRNVDRAYWAGSYLIVVLENGEIRRYRDHIFYEVVG